MWSSALRVEGVPVSVYVRICSRPFTSVVVLAAAVAAALVLAVFASAPGGAATPAAGRDDPPVVYKAKESASGPLTGGYVFVGCPSGYQATGGGFDVHSDPSQPNKNWLLTTSRPSEPGEDTDRSSPAGAGWVIEAIRSNNKYNPPSFTAYAVCAKRTLLGPDGARYGSSTTVVEGRYGPKVAELFTSCAHGSRVVGGGFDFLGERSERRLSLVRTERADHRTWQIGALYDLPLNTKKDIKAYRVCVPEEAIGAFHYERDVETGDGAVNANTPLCPDGTHLLSGGAGVANSDANKVLWSHIRPGGGDRHWSAGGYNTGGLFSKLTLWSFGVCAELNGQRASKSSGMNPGWGDGIGGRRFK
jgi:hypothetical protein